jgi:uncharacterized surface protein with fasciclin (FAS1) repeats
MSKYSTLGVLYVGLALASATNTTARAVTAVAATQDIVGTAVGAGSFKTLAAALQAADLVDALKAKGPYTVFAPTDEAFAKLPKGTVETLLKPENKQKLIDTLAYHVVKGKVLAGDVVKLSGATSLNGQQIDIKVVDGKVSVDKATVLKADIACSNGVIHVVDQVLLPATDNIPTTAAKAERFTTLLAAAKAAGLVEALSAEGPLTVFAPTDEAFAKLPAGTVETLLKPENKAKLVSILTYHVVPGRVYSTAALAAGKAKTLQGQSVSIAVKNGSAMVNNAKLIATDLDASNGVIHVIDTVIMPPESKQAGVMPHDMIQLAIQEGAPLFNAGHVSECAQVYMTTAKRLLSMENHGMSSQVTTTLQTAVNKAEHCNCSNTQAWTLRHALDSAYTSMQASVR